MANLESCPKCGSLDTCEIAYGYPIDEEEHLKLVTKRRVFHGGFTVNPNSPKRYCNDCQNKWGNANLEKMDFFDFQEEFDIKVVYGQ